MTIKHLCLALAFTLTTAPAFAASDLTVDIQSQQGVYVYDTTSYDIKVRNGGNHNASNVSLTVQLPETGTSPTVYVMGDLGYVDSRCNQVGTQLICSLGKIKKNKSKEVSFDIRLPEVAGSLVVDASAATTSSETSTSNNSDSDVASQLNYDVVLLGGEDIHNRHCTGTSLTSFYECELYPSSIMSHDAVYNVDGSVSFPLYPDFTGTWDQPSDDMLVFQYTYMGQIQADFVGYGVGGGCFEGLTTFPGSPYVAPYEVCVQ